TVSIQEKLSLAKLGGFANPQPPPMYKFKLPFYMAGSLEFRGNTKLEGVPPGTSGPSQAKLQDTKHGGNRAETTGASFTFTLGVPILVTENIFLEAFAKDGSGTYRGSGSAKAPNQLGPVDFGDLVLKPGSSTNAGEEITKLVFGPPCDYAAALRRAQDILKSDPQNEWITRNYSVLEESANREADVKKAIEQAKTLLANKDIDKAVTVLEGAYGYAPDCWQKDLKALLEQATTADKRIQELTRQAAQLVNGCKFDEALKVARDVEQISPQHPWVIEEKP